jgi:hypothetical protein
MGGENRSGMKWRLQSAHQLDLSFRFGGHRPRCLMAGNLSAKEWRASTGKFTFFRRDEAAKCP